MGIDNWKSNAYELGQQDASWDLLLKDPMKPDELLESFQWNLDVGRLRHHQKIQYLTGYRDKIKEGETSGK